MVEIHHVVWIFFTTISTRSFLDCSYFLNKLILSPSGFVDVVSFVVLVVITVVLALTFQTDTTSSILLGSVYREPQERFLL